MMNFNDLKSKIIALATEHGDIEILWLYGSYAKGTFHAGSDIDLAVVFKHWQEDIIERRLKSELLAIEWQKELCLKEAELSILDMEIASIPLAMSVLSTGKLLLSKNNSRQFKEQQRIMSIWEIDYLYHYKNKQAIYG
jgi:predicted nucleotidyltransferase